MTAQPFESRLERAGCGHLCDVQDIGADMCPACLDSLDAMYELQEQHEADAAPEDLEPADPADRLRQRIGAWTDGTNGRTRADVATDFAAVMGCDIRTAGPAPLARYLEYVTGPRPVEDVPLPEAPTGERRVS